MANIVKKIQKTRVRSIQISRQNFKKNKNLLTVQKAASSILHISPAQISNPLSQSSHTDDENCIYIRIYLFVYRRKRAYIPRREQFRRSSPAHCRARLHSSTQLSSPRASRAQRAQSPLPWTAEAATAAASASPQEAKEGKHTAGRESSGEYC